MTPERPVPAHPVPAHLIVALVAVLAAVLAGGSSVAAAHPLTPTVTIPVDEPTTIRIQVAAEGRSAMVGIDLEVPDGFRVEGPGQPQGWTASVDGGRVRYRGPQVPIGGMATFDLRGTATRRGELTIPVVTVAADGTTVEWRGGENPPVVVYAGVSPAGAGGGAGGGGGDFGLVLAVGVVGIVVIGAGVLLLRRRRAV